MHWFDKKYICDHVSEAARLEQLAEEAAEVSQAALKLARVLRDENPTSTSEEKARKELLEEVSDFNVIAETLDLSPDKDYMARKVTRWVNRLQTKHGDIYRTVEVDNEKITWSYGGSGTNGK